MKVGDLVRFGYPTTISRMGVGIVMSVEVDPKRDPYWKTVTVYFSGSGDVQVCRISDLVMIEDSDLHN